MTKTDEKEFGRVWIMLGIFASLLVVVCIIAFVSGVKDTTGAFQAASDGSVSDPKIEIGDNKKWPQHIIL